MTLSLEQLSSRMRRGEDIPLRETAQVVLALSVPSILQQMVVTAMEYIDAAMVGHIGAEATAAIGIVSSSTWLLHGILVGLYTAFSIQIAQYLGADRQADARGVLRQAMLFNLILGLAAAGFGIGISRFLPGWLGADLSLQANASAYFAIWSAALPFTMAMGMYAAMLRATGDALTPGLISVLVCGLDVVFNFFLINPTRTLPLFGTRVTVWGAGLGVPGAALGTALSNVIGGLLALAILLLRDGPLCIRKPGSWKITRACLLNLWRVGAPLAAERAALSSAQVVLVRIVSGLGTVAIAANSLGVSAEGLCYMAGYGIQDAAIALIDKGEINCCGGVIGQEGNAFEQQAQGGNVQTENDFSQQGMQQTLAGTGQQGVQNVTIGGHQNAAQTQTVAQGQQNGQTTDVETEETSERETKKPKQKSGMFGRISSIFKKVTNAAGNLVNDDDDRFMASRKDK